MITGQRENIFNAFELQRFTDEMTSRDSGHYRLLLLTNSRLVQSHTGRQSNFA
jgi:hypothetical protein